MPLYEYQCEKCGKLFEVLQRYSDAPLTVHENCGGAVVKQLSAPGFQFKGSGWYVTDYGKGGAKPEAKSEGKSETKAESTSGDSGAKTESKPASETKSESKPAPAAKTD
jgi:putative FmdB family regulatory protein